MAQTEVSLITTVLEELGVLGAGQTASAEDSEAVRVKIAPVLSELAARNVIYIPDSDDIDDAIFNPLVLYMASVCGPKFGKTRDAGAESMAERQMRIASAGRTFVQPLKVDYF